jgi:aspartate/methionine/tyrosine aminotransferase
MTKSNWRKEDTGRYPNKNYSEFVKLRHENPIIMGYGDPAVGAKIPTNLQNVIVDELSKSGAGAYSVERGEPALIESFTNFIKKDENIESDFDLAIGTAGGRNILTATFKTLSSGDGILVADPAWSGYKALAADARVNLVRVPTTSENQFIPSVEELHRTIERYSGVGRISAIAVNSPHNPTGTVFKESDLEGILHFAKEQNLTVFGDYTYRAIRKDGTFVPSLHKIAEEIAAREGVDPHQYTDLIVAMQTLGKVTLTPGLRVGYVMSTKPGFIGEFCQKKQPNDLSGHVFLQKALARYIGTEKQKEDFETTVSNFESRRKVLLDAMSQYGYSEKEGNIVAQPVGFYVTFEVPERFKEMHVPVSDLDKLVEKYPFIGESVSKNEYKALFSQRGYVPSSELFALEMADKTGIAVCPGHLFSTSADKVSGYENWIRIALIQPEEVLYDCFERIGQHEGLLQYK